MYRRPPGSKNPTETILCKTHNCPTVGSFYYLVEERLLQFLERYLNDYKIVVQNEDSGDWTEVLDRKMSVLAGYQNEAFILDKQLEMVYDYFEQQVYSLDLFRKRCNELTRKIDEHNKLMETIQGEITEIKERITKKEEFIPYFEGILRSYTEAKDPLKKNILLKQVVDHVFYTKIKKGNRLGQGNDLFTLDVYLKLPYKD